MQDIKAVTMMEFSLAVSALVQGQADAGQQVLLARIAQGQAGLLLAHMLYNYICGVAPHLWEPLCLAPARPW
ncbi:hypothetical protein Knedl_CDS0014 [Pseudomonas phage Knedl]|nr:hypothetical protein Knedl_CDS0014 [Pseudomonas phage Knedl]